MTDFKAKMHQIQLWLTPLGELRPSDPLAGFGGLLLREGEGRRGKRWGGKARGGEGRGGERIGS